MDWIYIGEYYHIKEKEIPLDCKFGVTNDLSSREYSLSRTKSPINYRMVKAWRVPDNMKREDIENLISIVFSEQKYDGYEWYDIDLETFYDKIISIFDQLKRMTGGDYFNLEEEDLVSKGYTDETIEEIIEKRATYTNLNITIDNVIITGERAKDRFSNFIKYLLDNNIKDISTLSVDFTNILKKNISEYSQYAQNQLSFIDGYYLNCHNSTYEKKRIIDKISSKYNLGVICDIVSQK